MGYLILESILNQDKHLPWALLLIFAASRPRLAPPLRIGDISLHEGQEFGPESAPSLDLDPYFLQI